MVVFGTGKAGNLLGRVDELVKALVAKGVTAVEKARRILFLVFVVAAWTG